MEQKAALPPRQRRRLVSLIGLALFCTTFGQPGVIGGYPIRFFLKDQLQLGPSAVSGFFLVATLFWYLKPLVGFITDSLPLWGTRRKSYLLLSAAGAAVLWVGVGLAGRHYALLLAFTILLNGALVFGSTV